MLVNVESAVAFASATLESVRGVVPNSDVLTVEDMHTIYLHVVEKATYVEVEEYECDVLPEEDLDLISADVLREFPELRNLDIARQREFAELVMETVAQAEGIVQGL